MPKVLKTINKIKGMLRVENPTVSLTPEYCQLIRNYYNSNGSWFKRTGCTKKNTVALDGSIGAIREVMWDDGHKEFLISAGTKWYKSFDFSVNTVIKSYLASGYPIDVSQFKITNGQCIISSALSTPQKYNNVALSNLSSGLPNTSGMFYSFHDLSTAIPRSIVKDSTNTYLYMVCSTSGSETSVYKIRIADNSIVGTVSTGITAGTTCLCIDSTDTNLYVLSQSTPSAVSKIRLSDFTYVSTKTLASGESGAQRMAIDSTNTYIYIATGGAVGYTAKLVRLTLSDFSTTSTLDLAQGTATTTDVVVNSTHAFVLFYATYKVIRVLLSDFSTTASKTLPSNACSRMLLDSAYLYVSTQTTPAYVHKVTLADFSTTVTATLPVNNAWGMAIVGYDLFIGTDLSIAKIDLNNYTTTALYTTISQNIYDLCYITLGKLYGGATSGLGIINIYGNPKFVEVHKNKNWLFGFDGDTYRLYAYYSKTADATDYTTANDAGYLTFGTVLSTYDDPTGMKSWGDYIVFFFKNNILIYSAGTNPNDFQLVKHIHNIGSLSNEVLQVGNDLWFPTRWGLRSLKNAISLGDVQYNNVSEDIDPFWSDNIAVSGTNLDRMSIKYDKKREQIMVLVNNSVTQGVCFYVYSIQDKAWSTYNINGLGANVSITCFTVTLDGLIYFGTSDGYIYELFSGTTDNGTAIDYIIRPVTQYFGTMDNNKKIKYLRLGVNGTIGTGNIVYDIDKRNLPSTATNIVKTFAGTLGLGYSELVTILGRGKSWDFQITNCGEIREITYYGEVQK